MVHVTQAEPSTKEGGNDRQAERYDAGRRPDPG